MQCCITARGGQIWTGVNPHSLSYLATSQHSNDKVMPCNAHHIPGGAGGQRRCSPGFGPISYTHTHKLPRCSSAFLRGVFCVYVSLEWIVGDQKTRLTFSKGANDRASVWLGPKAIPSFRRCIKRSKVSKRSVKRGCLLDPRGQHRARHVNMKRGATFVSSAGLICMLSTAVPPLPLRNPSALLRTLWHEYAGYQQRTREKAKVSLVT